MRRSWLRSKRRQALGQPGPAGYPPRVLLFVTSLLWWNSRAEALNTVNAKLAGPLLPGLPNRFSAVNRRGFRVYGQSGFSRAGQVEVLHPSALGTWRSSLPRTAGGRFGSWYFGTRLALAHHQAPPLNDRAESRLARRLRAVLRECRRLRSARFGDPPELYSRC
jgi:hypothetical protein